LSGASLSEQIRGDGIAFNVKTANSISSIEVVIGESTFFSTEADDLWSLALVDTEPGLKNLDPAACASTSVENQEKESLDLVWKDCGVGTNGLVDVIAHIGLNHLNQGSISLSVRNAHGFGLYQATLSLPLKEGMSSQDVLFVPDSYGVQALDPANSMSSWGSTYPSAGASMQFFAYETSDESAYLAVHDKSMSWKQLNWDNGVFRVTMTPHDSTVALDDGIWDQPFPLVVARLPEVTDTNPLWFAASELYRNFIFDEQDDVARWVSKGLIRDRMPDFLSGSDVWLNTGWQCHDIFEVEEGDPATALDRVTRLAAKWREKGLDSPIGLHWYEWQQGPEDGEENRYKFDTHYPDYFPARVSDDGEELKSATEKMLKDSGVYVYPYINGRIFDLNSTSFLNDNGEQVCVKVPNTDNVKLYDPNGDYELVTTTESYGSGPTFCVVNPFEAYWQDKVADVVEQLVTSEGSSGVYIDQVASAPMQLCYDPEMNHALGNGGWWVEGYRSMMKEINERVPGSPMVTESNAEVYMDQVEGYLILTVFTKSFTRKETSPWSVPAFASVYGGYFNSFGAEFYASDFLDTQYLKAKLAKQYLYGTQLGWFSLGGVEDDACGEMGLFDLFMGDEQDEITDWIVTLANSRGEWRDYFLEGRAVQDVALDVDVIQQAEER